MVKIDLDHSPSEFPSLNVPRLGWSYMSLKTVCRSPRQSLRGHLKTKPFHPRLLACRLWQRTPEALRNMSYRGTTFCKIVFMAFALTLLGGSVFTGPAAARSAQTPLASVDIPK